MPVSPDVLYFRILLHRWLTSLHFSLLLIKWHQGCFIIIFLQLVIFWDYIKMPQGHHLCYKHQVQMKFCSELIFQYKQIYFDWSGMNVNSPLYIQSISLFFCFVSVMLFFFYKSLQSFAHALPSMYPLRFASFFFSIDPFPFKCNLGFTIHWGFLKPSSVQQKFIYEVSCPHGLSISTKNLSLLV